MRDPGTPLFTCDISGLVAAPLEDEAGDDLGDLPLGWTVVTLSTRLPNPQYETLMQARDAAVNGMLAQAGIEEGEEGELAIVEMMATAQFAPLLEQTPPYLIEDTELHVHPEHIGEFLEAIGLADEIQPPSVGEPSPAPAVEPAAVPAAGPVEAEPA